MMATVDSMEWINLKLLRGHRYLWRHVVLSVLAVALFGRKRLTVGLDAHTVEDWQRWHASGAPAASVTTSSRAAS
jgi:hypothetical protein